MKKMTVETVVDELHLMAGSCFAKVINTATYEEKGMLTKDKGFVIKYDDGTEFQVTVVQSK